MKTSQSTKFVTVRMALKGGKTKADYLEACKEKGITARYSGKELYDDKGKLLRAKGFYLS